MNGFDFIEMCRQDIQTHSNRETLETVVDAMEWIVKENPTCNIDERKTAQECYKEMEKFAQKNASNKMFCFNPNTAKKFISEYLEIKEQKLVSLEDFL